MARTELIVTRPKPTVLDRLRSYWSGPLTAKSPEIARYLGGGYSTLSGVSVNESSALTSSAVFSAVALISDDIASLPLFLYKRLPTGGKDRFEAHPLYKLLHDAPNPEMDSMVMRRTLTAHVLIWQNAYAEIERDGTGRPVAIWPLIPDRVHPFRDGSGPLQYRVLNPSGNATTIAAEDMLHLVGRSHDGSVGASLVDVARESIGLGLAAEKFGAAFFGNGSTFGGAISYAGPKPPALSAKNEQDTTESRHQGVMHAFRLLALYNGAKLEKFGVAPNEGQFNETRIFQIREIARWFKIPPHKLGDLADATYSNVEQMDAAYYSSCIRPWLVLWEQQLTRKLISPLERRQQFIEHDTHGFLSVDAAARAELYTSEFRVGSLSPNEIRGYENRDPLTGGEDAFVSLDVMPLRLAGAYWQLQLDEKQAQIEKLKQPPPAPVAPIAPNPAETKALTDAVAELRARSEADAIEYRKALQRAEDLSAALAQDTGAKDEARAAEAHVRELLAGAEQALAQERSDYKINEGMWKMRVDQLVESAAVSQEARDALQTRLDVETAAHGAAVEAQAALEATRQAETARLTAERDAVQAERDAAISEKQAAAVRDANAIAAAGITFIEATAEKVAAEQRAEAAEAEAARHLATLIEATDSHQRALADAITARDEAVAGMNAAFQAQFAAEALQVSAEQRAAAAAERDKGIAEHAQAAANETIAALQAELAQTRTNHADRVAGVLVAHRGLIVDVMRRMVEREIDRAKRHQTTPQKFRAWLDTFYQTHVEAVTEALLPAVRAHLSILDTQQDAHAMARQLAEDHAAESEKQLRDLLYLEDFAPMLERTLQRWQDARPEQVADRLLTKGLADVR